MPMVPGSGNYGARAIVYLQELAGAFEEGCASTESRTYRGIRSTSGQPIHSSSRCGFELTTAGASAWL